MTSKKPKPREEQRRDGVRAASAELEACARKLTEQAGRMTSQSDAAAWHELADAFRVVADVARTGERRAREKARAF